MLPNESKLGRVPAEHFLQHCMAPKLDRERRHFRQFVSVDLAHTVMLFEQGVLTKEQTRKLLRALLGIRAAGPTTFPIDPNSGSLLLQVEAHLRTRIGDDCAGRMHTGRSRIDQGAAVRRLYKRDRILDVMTILCELQEILLAVARQHARTVMPGYTHMQHAQPWIFGHYLLSFNARFHDDLRRLVESFSRVNLNPLGAVGLSGTSWPLNRQRTTQLLGFSGLLENSKLAREAYYAAEAIAALSFVMCNLNDLATDLHVWSTYEFGIVETDDGYCGTSSIFPQKKNPAALETIKKAAGGATTWLATALATIRGEGTGDQAVRELPIIDEAFRTTESMIDLMAGIIETLTVHEARMRQLVSSNWCTASNLADLLVRERGLSFRNAHHVVGRLVKICLKSGIAPADVSTALLDQAGRETIKKDIGLSLTEVLGALDPDTFVLTRVTTGSIAPQEIDRMLASALQQHESDALWIHHQREDIAAAEKLLDATIEKIFA